MSSAVHINGIESTKRSTTLLSNEFAFNNQKNHHCIHWHCGGSHLNAIWEKYKHAQRQDVTKLLLLQSNATFTDSENDECVKGALLYSKAVGPVFQKNPRNGFHITNDWSLILVLITPKILSFMQFQILVNSLFKVLFIFPSRYLFAIGFLLIFNISRALSAYSGCTLKQPYSRKEKSV